MKYESYNTGRRAVFFPEITPIIKILIIANSIVFGFSYISQGINIFFLKNFSLIPNMITTKFQIWRLVTYMFLHADFMHILFNMLFLWWFGSELEKIWGPKLFLKYYFITGILGGAFHLVQPNSPIPVIGASAAVMGILLAYGLKWPNRTVLLWFVLPVKMKWVVLFSVIIAFIGAVDFSHGSGIAHLAHLGGMVVGFIYLNYNRLIWKIKDRQYNKQKQKKKNSFKIINGKGPDLNDFFDDDDNDNNYTVH
ncbi:MAG: rhomboid family intramembrane serine protease [Acidobacteria bacterium]|nr:rhomboid family intramembrane serine protease [Acidobacteriota bacterium]